MTKIPLDGPHREDVSDCSKGSVMGEERALIDSLTDAEREALSAYLSKSEIKEVARVLGRSPHTVEQRLKRARRKLGVRRSIDAAHMLARVNAGTYGSPVYASSDIAEGNGDRSNVVPAEEGSGRFPMPFPTKGRPWNDSSIWVRIVAIVVVVFIATASALLSSSLLESINRLVGQKQ